MDSTVPSGRAHLLVIEDNPADVDLLRRALAIAECDCQLSIIEDGAEALALFKPGANPAVPDLAIIDLNLPKHGGLEIIEQMRAHPAFAGVPVIILSSSSSLSDRSRLEKYHIERYIVKPADLEEFMKIGWQIRELLSATRAQSDPSEP
jgi:DNA-binding response OmpR family regulator